jgi:phosphosulfolactate synthase (CoM biosynthesis protein A)
VIDTELRLPDREPKPRRRGLTMVIDPGLLTGQFEDAVDSVGEFVDLVKFGWGTCLVTKDIKRKIDVLRSAGIDLDRLLFEAPNKDLQAYFLRRMAPWANLGNVRADDVIALETLRRGLRSDTLLGVL